MEEGVGGGTMPLNSEENVRLTTFVLFFWGGDIRNLVFFIRNISP